MSGQAWVNRVIWPDGPDDRPNPYAPAVDEHGVPLVDDHGEPLVNIVQVLRFMTELRGVDGVVAGSTFAGDETTASVAELAQHSVSIWCSCGEYFRMEHAGLFMVPGVLARRKLDRRTIWLPYQFEAPWPRDEHGEPQLPEFAEDAQAPQLRWLAPPSDRTEWFERMRWLSLFDYPRAEFALWLQLQTPETLATKREFFAEFLPEWRELRPEQLFRADLELDTNRWGEALGPRWDAAA